MRNKILGSARVTGLCRDSSRGGGATLSPKRGFVKRNRDQPSCAQQNYVISANGMDCNPDDPTLEALVAARGQTGFTIWLTNYDVPGRDLRQRIN